MPFYMVTVKDKHLADGYDTSTQAVVRANSETLARGAVMEADLFNEDQDYTIERISDTDEAAVILENNRTDSL